jgi:predicted enzyme related to lactoylglutathione lyase
VLAAAAAWLSLAATTRCSTGGVDAERTPDAIVRIVQSYGRRPTHAGGTQPPRSSAMNVESVSAVLFYSPDPARLAQFYRAHLGIPFELDRHGAIREHQEADLGDIHLAVLKGRGPGADGGGISTTFRVHGLDAFAKRLGEAGTPLLQPILDLGEGKRVASFRDPDGNAFNLVEIHP